MTEQLKPCPFCGGQAVVKARYKPSDDGDDWLYTWIECPDHITMTREDWNARPTEAAQAAEIERLRAALERISHPVYLLTQAEMWEIADKALKGKASK